MMPGQVVYGVQNFSGTALDAIREDTGVEMVQVNVTVERIWASRVMLYIRLP